MRFKFLLIYCLSFLFVYFTLAIISRSFLDFTQLLSKVGTCGEVGNYLILL